MDIWKDINLEGLSSRSVSDRALHGTISEVLFNIPKPRLRPRFSRPETRSTRANSKQGAHLETDPSNSTDGVVDKDAISHMVEDKVVQPRLRMADAPGLVSFCGLGLALGFMLLMRCLLALTRRWMLSATALVRDCIFGAVKSHTTRGVVLRLELLLSLCLSFNGSAGDLMKCSPCNNSQATIWHATTCRVLA